MSQKARSNFEVLWKSGIFRLFKIPQKKGFHSSDFLTECIAKQVLKRSNKKKKNKFVL